MDHSIGNHILHRMVKSCILVILATLPLCILHISFEISIYVDGQSNINFLWNLILLTNWHFTPE